MQSNPNHPDPAKQQIIDATVAAGHSHVFRWWDSIDDEGKERLLGQLSAIDFDELHTLYEQSANLDACLPKGEIQPGDVIHMPKTAGEKAEREKARSTGEKALCAGEVAVFVVAGGQATRLGMDAPKGTLPITPVKKKTIFEHHAEKIRALSRRYETTLPFYIMTSESNESQTREFFDANGFFGLDPANVFFFKQEMIPALDLDGKLILDAMDHIFMNPNGHGGSLSSLASSGALADMQSRGLKHIFYFQVDNILIKIADPSFLGYHIGREAEMSAKVAPKTGPEEKVGVVCRVGTETTVIEYSDLPDEYKYALNEDGSLKFSAGNLAIHALDVGFVQRLYEEEHSLPFHVAQKAVPFLSDDGELIRPDDKNGLKFEMFVFDALSRARTTAIMEVNRDEEFAPVKNVEGEDSPASALEMIQRFHSGWLEEAGVQVPRDADGRPAGPLEISPLYALDATELKAKLPANFKVEFPLYLGP